MKVDNIHLVLGSSSPRRRDLLQAMGYQIEIRRPECQETYPDTLNIHEIPLYLSLQKAQALLPGLQDDELLITADTIVALDQQVLGKPKDAKTAYEMLTKLSGKTHEVITGFCVCFRGQKIVRQAITKVSFGALTEEEIKYYVDTFQPLDKAGSYGIQEWIGLIGIKAIEGSYSNVVGLPCYLVRQAILELLDAHR